MLELKGISRKSMALLLLGLAVGCATTSEPKALQAREICNRILNEKDAESRWRLCFTLASLADAESRSTLLNLTEDPETLCRNFAILGLGKLLPDPEVESRLRELLKDADLYVRARAATILGKAPSRENLDALVLALADPSFHIRRACVESLGNYKEFADLAKPHIQKSFEDPSIMVRAESALALAHLLGDDAAPEVRRESKSSESLSRVKAAEAARYLSDEKARPLLSILIEDEDPKVASAAAQTLHYHPKDWSRELALRALAVKELSIRSEAASTLKEIGDSSLLPKLVSAYTDSSGHGMAEARENLVAAAAKLAEKEALPFLRSALSDEDDAVRAEAFQRIREILKGAPVRAEIKTSKGALILELFPEDAPEHVYNFLELAKAGHYDGTPFHRVVSNWVVQGGDHRGDGWGATSIRGGYLRDETNHRPYLRGSVGMPKGSHRDTGGCQFFITLIPTPKLDGNYTLFGQVVEGLEILDRIEIGDKILTVREL